MSRPPFPFRGRLQRGAALASLVAALCTPRASHAAPTGPAPSILRALKGPKLSVGLELSHADLPPDPDRGLGVSVLHQNLYDASDDELRAIPVRQLSKVLREGNAACIAVRGPGRLMEHMPAEQREAKGAFPGPVPILYVPSGPDEDLGAAIPAAATAGASGVLLVCGEVVADQAPSAGELERLAGLTKAASGAKLQAVIELGFDMTGDTQWDESETQKVLDQVTEATGAELFVLASKGDRVAPVPGPYKGRVMGGVRAPWNDITDVCERLRDAGYAGALLRSECMPLAARDVQDWGDFWANIIANVRSAKSKNLVMMVAEHKQKDAMKAYVEKVKASGQFDALGKGESLGGDFDSSRGDYVGF